jgi:2-polyprenyl-3-methyl-5-hydroxy-6-metoxy-1,4-benzoquinol methylase
MIPVRACPVCGASDADVLHHQLFAVPEDWPLPSEYDVVACTVCGFVYADTPACQADYDVLYRELSKYEDASTGTGGGDTAEDWTRLQVTARTVARFVPDRGAPVLDIGCGNGGLLRALREEGFTDLTGIDPSPACARRVSDAGEKGIAGSLLSMDPGILSALRGSFAAVVLSHVLEHLCDVTTAVRVALDCLGPDGVLYLEVPDAAGYGSHFVVPYYYFDGEHINHFDERSLRNLAARFGLEVLDAASKDVTLSDGLLYPAVWAAMRRSADGSTGEIVRDDAARGSVEELLRTSREHDEWPELREIASGGDPVVVWGAGSHAQRMLRDTPLGDCAILYFVDMDAKKHGSSLAGREVRPPEVLLGFEGTIVVCAAVAAGEIEREIRSRGLRNRVLLLNGR